MAFGSNCWIGLISYTWCVCMCTCVCVYVSTTGVDLPETPHFCPLLEEFVLPWTLEGGSVYLVYTGDWTTVFNQPRGH